MDNKVLVLLSTYNGEKYLSDQLDSIMKQADVDVSVLVRDDGSSDSTCSILDKWSRKMNLQWYSGNNLGSAKSFLELIQSAPSSDFYALCDQDDIWHEDKLISAIRLLKCNDADLYHSAFSTTHEKEGKLTAIHDNVNKKVFSSLGPSFVYAFVTGCTVVFTNSLRKKLRLYSPINIMMHDSWLLKVALSTDSKVVYDEKSHIYYRQHNHNVIGAHQSVSKKWKGRLNRLKTGTRRRYLEVEELYKGYGEMMSKENHNIVSTLIGYDNKPLFDRLKIAFDKRFSTGVLSSDIMFTLSIIFKIF